MALSKISQSPGNHYNNQLISRTRMATPDWDFIPHKGMPRLSDEELESKIDSLGKALAEARNNPRQYEKIRQEADKLMVQYVSEASPDRQKLVKDTTNFFEGAANFCKRKRNDGEPLTLFDYIMKKDAKIKSAEDGQFSIELNTGTTITYVGSAQQPDMLEIKGDGYDQTVISYSNGRWLYENTPQEFARQTGFIMRINDAENRYVAESKNLASQPQPNKSKNLNITA